MSVLYTPGFKDVLFIYLFPTTLKGQWDTHGLYLDSQFVCSRGLAVPKLHKSKEHFQQAGGRSINSEVSDILLVGVEQLCRVR